MQKPTVGRIVHYVSFGTPGGEFSSVCKAAIVAGVPEPVAFDRERPATWGGDTLDLCVLNPTGLFFNRCEQSDADHRGGTWHWPERED